MPANAAVGLSDRDLIAALKARGYSVTKPKLDPKRLIYPLPVYEARFAGGEVARFSLHCWHGKPLPFERARQIAAQAIANERGWSAIQRRPYVFKAEGSPREALKRAGWDYDVDTPVKIGVATVPAWQITRSNLYLATFPPVTDQIAGQFEDGNIVSPDPAFLKGHSAKPRPEIIFEPQPLFAGGRK